MLLEREEGMRLSALHGKASIAYLGAVLHQYTLSEQAALLQNIIHHLQPVAGSLIFGHNLAYKNDGGEYPVGLSDKLVFIHNEPSFRMLWVQLGIQTGSKWDLEVDLVAVEGKAGFDKAGMWSEHGACLVKWCATRMVGDPREYDSLGNLHDGKEVVALEGMGA